MKRALITIAAIMALAWPVKALAQYALMEDSSNPYEYRDVDNGQLLQLASYILTPFGMGLEWGLMRPLHYLATQSAIAPILSGDNDRAYFGQNHNSDLVPAGTFDPAPMNLTDDFVPSPPAAEVSMTPRHSSRRALPGGQPALQ